MYAVNVVSIRSDAERAGTLNRHMYIAGLILFNSMKSEDQLRKTNMALEVLEHEVFMTQRLDSIYQCDRLKGVSKTVRKRLKRNDCVNRMVHWNH